MHLCLASNCDGQASDRCVVVVIDMVAEGMAILSGRAWTCGRADVVFFSKHLDLLNTVQ